MKLLLALSWLILSPCVCHSQIKPQLDSTATYPCIGYAIAKHESNLGKSSLAKRTNNLYGMKSEAYRIGKTKGNYSIYESIEHSVLAYVEFEGRIIQSNPKLDTGAKYLNYIARFYAHPQHQKQWLKQVKSIYKTCYLKQDTVNFSSVGN